MDNLQKISYLENEIKQIDEKVNRIRATRYLIKRKIKRLKRKIERETLCQKNGN